MVIRRPSKREQMRNNPPPVESPQERVARREAMALTFEKWEERGDVICIFENHDLGHPDIGRRIAMPFGAEHEAKLLTQDEATRQNRSSIETAGSHVVMPSRAPDHASIGLGWRYLLVKKTRSAQEAVACMWEREP